MNKLSLRTLVKNRKKKGFTLVELIIVIAIIAILAAIAIPKFGQITKNSNITADIATAKNLHGIGAQVVAEDQPAAGDISDKVKIKVDGEVMPTSKVTKKAFAVAVDDKGNISVTSDSKKVYPTQDSDFQKAS